MSTFSTRRPLHTSLWGAFVRALSCGLLLATSAPVKISVLPNGAPRNEIPAVFDSNSWEELRQQVHDTWRGGSPPGDLGRDWWFADANGRSISSWTDLMALAPEDRLLSAVPAGRLFQWGPRAAGERFMVEVSDRDGVELETVAGTPRIFIMHNLFSEEEASAIIDTAENKTGQFRLKKSGVGFTTTGDRAQFSKRTSENAFDFESPTAGTVMRRAFDALRIPWENSLADGLQILRYKEGDAYVPHMDWFPADTSADRSTPGGFDPATPDGSNRFATVFLYLRPPPSGGFTVFPRAKLHTGLKDSDLVSTGMNKTAAAEAMTEAKQFFKAGAWELELVQTCYKRLSVRPVSLSAVLFYHQDPMSGRLLPEAEHGACPSLTGTKWGANLWLWNRARHLSPSPAPCAAQFTNDEANPLDLEFTTDFGETWVQFQTVPAGGMAGANTFSSHGWRFTNAGAEVQRWSVPIGVTALSFRASAAEPEQPKVLQNNLHQEL